MRSALFALLPLLLAAHTSADPADPSSTAAAGVRPVTESVRLECGRQGALAFTRQGPTEAAERWTTISSAPNVLAVESELEFAAGVDLGYVFVEPRNPGLAVVRVTTPAGATECRVEVVRNRVQPFVTILTPFRGAVLWGQVGACARVYDDQPVRLEWFLDEEPLAAAFGQTESSCTIDARGRPGVRRLRVRAVDASGNEAWDERVIEFAAEDAVAVDTREAEDAPEPESSETLRLLRAPTRAEPGASGGAVASLYASIQVLPFDVEVPRSGFFQLVVTARGDHYLTHPSLSVRVEAQEIPVGAGPIPSADRYGRFAVGGPFRMEAGRRRITLQYYNDDSDPSTGLDRNVHLDRLELRRLDEGWREKIAPTSALLRPDADQEVGGRLDVAALAFDDDRVDHQRLIVDGVEVARQAGDRLVHSIPAGALAPGVHTIQVVAVDVSGNEGRSHLRRVIRLPWNGKPPAAHRLLAHQGSGANARLDTDVTAPHGTCWILGVSGATVAFAVDSDREGEFQVEILARADGTGTATVRSDPAAAEIRVPAVGAAYDAIEAGAIPLRRGRNRITVSADGPLRLAGLTLWEAGADATPPWVEIAWPPNETRLGPSDLVAIRSSDDSEVSRVELRVDGELADVAGGGGLTAAWLHGERLAPGTHEIQAWAVDRYGNRAASAARRITLETPAGTALGATERASHLLRRAGLGASPRSLAALLVEGEDPWLTRQLGPADPAGEPVDLVFVPLLRANPYNAPGLRWAVLAKAVFTDFPVRERATAFLENHFSTWIAKTDAWREWGENALFRRLAFSSFDALLATSASSPAMITYLDNERNRRGALNENLARELLELHTLGARGGYVQADVEELARILTGWTAGIGYPWYQFAFSPAHHDAAPKTLLSVRFPGGNMIAESRRLIALLAAHPSTARFFARRLAGWLVADDPPEPLVEQAAERFRATGGDVGEMVRAILASAAFHDRRVYGNKIKDPYELIVGLHRLPLAVVDIGALDLWTGRLGQSLFGRSTPDGYPEEGTAWISSNTLLQRWNAASDVAARLAIRDLIGPPGEHRTLARLVDDLAMIFHGRPLEAEERAAVLSAFAGDRFSGDDPSVRAVAALILQLPGTQRN